MTKRKINGFSPHFQLKRNRKYLNQLNSWWVQCLADLFIFKYLLLQSVLIFTHVFFSFKMVLITEQWNCLSPFQIGSKINSKTHSFLSTVGWLSILVFLFLNKTYAKNYHVPRENRIPETLFLCWTFWIFKGMSKMTPAWVYVIKDT